MELDGILELNDVLEASQEFTYDLLRDYGYPNHDLIELWFEANHQWTVTLHRMNLAISLMNDLEELLGEKLSVEEADSLKSKRELIIRGRRHFDAFYLEADSFLVRELQYSAWLHSIFQGQGAPIYDLARHHSEDPWWQRQAVLSEDAAAKLRRVLTVENAPKQREEFMVILRLMHKNLLQRDAELSASKSFSPPDSVLTLGELQGKFDGLEVDHMFFD